jgi:hypothetical protein
MILHQIKDEVIMSQYCDETKNLSRVNNSLKCTLRYMHDGLIREEFIGVTFADSVNAESLKNEKV